MDALTNPTKVSLFDKEYFTTVLARHSRGHEIGSLSALAGI
jgi:hypothetical protein